MGFQVAVVVLGLVAILVGLAVAGLGMFVIIRRYIARNPTPPTSEAAREAGRRWERDIQDQEKKKESGEESE
jgi:hypothetical protein